MLSFFAVKIMKTRSGRAADSFLLAVENNVLPCISMTQDTEDVAEERGGAPESRYQAIISHSHQF